MMHMYPQAQKQLSWTLHAPPSVQAWVSVCRAEALGKFYAVCTTATSGQQVMTSVDGETWLGENASANQNWRSVCFSPDLNLLCAVSQTGVIGGRVMTSTGNGIWTPAAAATTNQWFYVGWVGGAIQMFVALAQTGTDNRIMTSINGTLWVSRTSTANVLWNGFAFDGTTIVAVGDSGSMMASTDGINWVTVNHGLTGTLFRGIEYCPELALFVLIIANTGVNRANIAYSVDGAAWTLGYTSPNVTGGVQRPAWSPELGVLAVQNSTTAGPAATTSSGKFMASGAVVGTDQRWQSTAYSPSLRAFVSVANGGAGDRAAKGVLAA